MYPGEIGAQAPDRPAVVMCAAGVVITFRELDERSNRLANLLRSRGIGRGGSIAIVLENHERFLEVVWAAQRSGIYYTAVNSHLTADEAGYIVDDSDATLVVSSKRLEGLATGLRSDLVPKVQHRLMVDGTAPGWESFEDAVAAQPATDVVDQCEGDYMLYSSGTTGRPKGIRRALPFAPMGQGVPAAVPLLQLLGMQDGDVYLSPAPLYHAAPLAWSLGSHRLGSTVVVLERFDPIEALAMIERYRVTHAQFVPTMFVRMLKLPAAARAQFDLSSLRAVVHAAAPCPVEIKRQMIEWWGPKIYEYYSSTEGAGATFIDSEQWIAHPGSVGRAILGTVHIVDDDGDELAPGEQGQIWFEGGPPFEYHNDPEKTASVTNEKGWATMGDVGYLDADGYLYLTDRRSFMIISGGVNVYPQEAESLLVTHPRVMDVAVVGIPNEDLGEEVKAIVQPVDWDAAGPELEQELLEFCRRHLATYKCPRSVDFERELPRLDTGKLYKRQLRDRYWPAST